MSRPFVVITRVCSNFVMGISRLILKHVYHYRPRRREPFLWARRLQPNCVDCNCAHTVPPFLTLDEPPKRTAVWFALSIRRTPTSICASLCRGHVGGVCGGGRRQQCRTNDHAERALTSLIALQGCDPKIVYAFTRSSRLSILSDHALSFDSLQLPSRLTMTRLF